MVLNATDLISAFFRNIRFPSSLMLPRFRSRITHHVSVARCSFPSCVIASGTPFPYHIHTLQMFSLFKNALATFSPANRKRRMFSRQIKNKNNVALCCKRKSHVLKSLRMDKTLRGIFQFSKTTQAVKAPFCSIVFGLHSTH